MPMDIPEGFEVSSAEITELVVRNDLRSAKEPEDHILRELERREYSPDCVFAIKLALEEAMTNAVKHGNCNDPNKHITVRYAIDDRRVVVMVRDEGRGFCPQAVPDPTAGENLERPNGRGIMLMNSYMTRVWYSPNGNEVWMLKYRDDVAP